MREDLAQLGPEALVLLANRGLVKRATRMMERGEGPVVVESADGTVSATYPDGPVVTWPVATAMKDADCTCGATTLCRHRVCAVLGYQASAGEAGEVVDEVWSPGEFDETQLEALVGGAALTKARKRVRDGLDAEVHRGTQPRVHLPNGTVRFPVPHALELAHCDAVGSEREVLIALAVWACRVSDGIGGEAPVVQVHLHDAEAVFDPEPFAALERWTRTAMASGIAGLPAPAAAQLARARTEVSQAGWVWVADALADLESQIAAHGSRDARYAAETAAGLIGEIGARRRAVRSPGPPSPGWFAGTGVAPETQLEHLTLTGLGARVRTVGEQIDVDVYLLDRRAGAVLVLSRSVDRAPDQELGLRRAGGGRLSLGALAAGQLTTQGAIRRANRQVRLAGERGVRKHDLKPGGGGWDDVPEPVRVASVEALRVELVERVPAVLRPRLRAEDLRVVPVHTIEAIGWRPGARELVASGTMPNGDPLRIRLAHDPAAPGAVGALEQALLDGPHHIAGHVRLAGEIVEIAPTAVAVQGRVVVPSFAVARSVSAQTVGDPPGDPVEAALRSARSGLADLAHHGLRASAGRRRSLERVAERLRALGMARSAVRVEGVLSAPDPYEAWLDAWLTITVALGHPRPAAGPAGLR